ncbi:MAG: ProQ/FINO family protein [Candidatus Competibacteraceae bacterium]
MSAVKKHAAALHALLMDRFPKAFPKDYDAILPLKRDIDADIRARLIASGEPVDPDLLRRVLANHTGRAGYLLALLHRPDGLRYDLDGRPVGAVDALARVEAARRLGEHQKRYQDASIRHRQHQALERQQQAAKAERSAERARRAAEKQRRREENERNRLRNLERQAAEARARDAAQRTGGAAPLPTVIRKKRRRIDPQGFDPQDGKE